MERVLQELCEVSVDIAEVGRLEHDLRSRGARVLGVEYTSEASLHFAIPPRAREATGEVIARVQRTENLQSINIRSTNYPGALFNISIITQADNSKKISGRIIHPQSGDVLILTEENNRYFLRKQSVKFFMTE